MPTVLLQKIIDILTAALAEINDALDEVGKGEIGEIPMHIRNAPIEDMKKLGYSNGYKYPHDFKNHYVKQQYLPSDLAGKHYYEFGANKTEQAAKAYWDLIKGGK